MLSSFSLSIFSASGVRYSNSKPVNMGKITVKGLQTLCLRGVVSTKYYWVLRKLIKKKYHRVQYQRTPFELSKFTDDECLLYFRFSANDIAKLVRGLRIPQLCALRNRVKFTGLEGLCITLRRLSYPNRLNDLVNMFQRDEGSISQIFNYMIKRLFTTFGNRLNSLNQPYLTRAKLQQLADNSSKNGSPYPNIIGFIDGTARPICRPTYNQRQMYSGYKKCHVFKYQSVVLTNGLIGRLDGPYIGRRHDAAILHISKILEEMNNFLVNNDGTWFAVYGDPGYSNQKFIKVGYKNQAVLNQRQKEFNAMMSALRVSVEYGFGKILQQFAFLL